jgi:excisionase family DNA binding protein
MDRNLLSVDELAESLNVPKSWIYSRTRETGPGAMPRIKVGKYVRFELDRVIDWLKKESEVD